MASFVLLGRTWLVLSFLAGQNEFKEKEKYGGPVHQLCTAWTRSRLWRGRAGGLLPPDPRGCAPGHAFARPAPRWVVLKKSNSGYHTKAPCQPHFQPCQQWPAAKEMGLTEGGSMRPWNS